MLHQSHFVVYPLPYKISKIKIGAAKKKKKKYTHGILQLVKYVIFLKFHGSICH